MNGQFENIVRPPASVAWERGTISEHYASACQCRLGNVECPRPLVWPGRGGRSQNIMHPPAGVAWDRHKNTDTEVHQEDGKETTECVLNIILFLVRE